MFDLVLNLRNLRELSKGVTRTKDPFFRPRENQSNQKRYEKSTEAQKEPSQGSLLLRQ
jgi:hypothetical protein